MNCIITWRFWRTGNREWVKFKRGDRWEINVDVVARLKVKVSRSLDDQMNHL